MIFTKRDKRTQVEREIDKQLDILISRARTPEEISEMLDLMERRDELRKKKVHVSPDTIAIIAGNLAGILLILNYEQFNVVSSKALGFVIKGRV